MASDPAQGLLIIGRDATVRGLFAGVARVHGVEDVVEVATAGEAADVEATRALLVLPDSDDVAGLSIERFPDGLVAIVDPRSDASAVEAVISQHAAGRTLRWPPSQAAVLSGLSIEEVPEGEEGATIEVDVPEPARAFGLISVLQLSLTCRFATEGGPVSFCVSRGLVRGAVSPNARLKEQDAIINDEKAQLALMMLPDDSDIAAELGFQCEYHQTISSAPAYRGFCEARVREVLERGTGSLTLSVHRVEKGGYSYINLLRETFRGAPELARVHVAEEDLLDLGGSVPPWLRRYLPPREYGELFAGLAGSALIGQAIQQAGMDVEPALAAIAVASLAEPREPLLVRGEGAVDMLPDAEETEVHTLPTQDILPAWAKGEAPEDAAAEPYLGWITEHAEAVRIKGKRVFVEGTRFEPWGRRQGELLLYFRIGVGYGGDVYLGVRPRDGKPELLAVKWLSAEEAGLDPLTTAEYVVEAERLVVRSHRNIVSVNEVVPHERGHLVAMELVHGVSLRELLAWNRGARERLNPRLVRYIGAEIAAGLDAIGRIAVTENTPVFTRHRDLVPANVLLSFKGRVQIRGFGTSVRQRTDKEDRRNQGPDRLPYTAPEALDPRRQASESADVFALGTILYELLTGWRCLARATPRDTVRAIGEADFVPIRRVCPYVPKDLADVIEWMLKADPDARPATCLEVREALLAEAQGDPPRRDLSRALARRFAKVETAEKRALRAVRRSGRKLLAAAAAAEESEADDDDAGEAVQDSA